VRHARRGGPRLGSISAACRRAQLRAEPEHRDAEQERSVDDPERDDFVSKWLAEHVPVDESQDAPLGPEGHAQAAAVVAESGVEVFEQTTVHRGRLNAAALRRADRQLDRTLTVRARRRDRSRGQCGARARAPRPRSRARRTPRATRAGPDGAPDGEDGPLPAPGGPRRALTGRSAAARRPVMRKEQGRSSRPAVPVSAIVRTKPRRAPVQSNCPAR
jgi:hypothetical protein